ncbi:MAG: peptidase M20 [Blastocatellia bacterium AA13]|nr:MAG: peptidase M20 [Blastocatellia bacterium AA13]
MITQPESCRTFLAHFQDLRQELLELIRWLVEQESMTRVAAATTAIAENLAEKLQADGVQVDTFTDARYGTNVRARYPLENSSESASDNKQLLIIGHIDTVWPMGTLAQRPFRIEDGRAYGPGIFDMKSGVGLAVFVLRTFKKLGRATRRPVTLLLTCDEETGSHFSRELIEEEAHRSKAALVLEPPIPGGRVKTGRKGGGEFELLIKGRAAHAGNDPRGGISAITELAHQTLAINAMSDYDVGTTLNVGVVSGGVLCNVIAADARASIDMRYSVVAEGERILRAFAALKPVLDGAKVEIRGQINRPPLVRNPSIVKLFEHARELAGYIGFELGEGSVGGGSDGNFVAALGVPVLDGLGVDGDGAHAEHEHIIIDDIPRRAALLAALIETI